MPRLWLIAGAAAALATAAQAQDSPMANVLGNTLVSKNPQGVESWIRYKDNGRFSGRVPALNFNFQGRWKLEGDQVCRTYQPPLPNRPNPECSPTLPWLQVGQTFTAPNGAVVTLKEGTK